MNELTQELHVSDEVTSLVAEEHQVDMFKGDLKISVSSKDVGALQREGWLLFSVSDVPGLSSGALMAYGEVIKNITKFVDGVVADGNIDSSDGLHLASLLAARRLADQQLETLLKVVYAAYPTKQGTGIQMYDTTGGQYEVDPGQVEEKLSEGWRLKDE